MATIEPRSESHVDRETLHAMPLLARFTDEQLDWLLEHSTEVEVPPGDLFAPGDRLEHMFVLLEGDLYIWRAYEGHRRTTGGSTDPGVWIGLPTVNPITQVGALVTVPTRLLQIDTAAMEHMITGGFPIAEHLLAGIGLALPQAEATARQQERMAVLGKMSAGLAHELNNPAAAAKRAAAQLLEAFKAVAATSLAVGDGVDTTTESLQRLQAEVTARAALPRPHDPMATSDAEDAAGEWLEEHAVPRAWSLAPDLVDANLDVEWLDRLAGEVGAQRLGAVLGWVTATVDAARLVEQVEEAATRLSDVAAAMKNYSHMDRAPQSDIDLRASLDSTLKIMSYRLRGVRVVRDYDPNLPRITAYGGELSSVWTNLIDNAVDSLADNGQVENDATIAVRATSAGGNVVVEISDNGPGISDDVLPRIFDPFFTTKAVGEGSGLGLDTVYRIVTLSHGGEITAVSKPGQTTFRIELPTEPPPP